MFAPDQQTRAERSPQFRVVRIQPRGLTAIYDCGNSITGALEQVRKVGVVEPIGRVQRNSPTVAAFSADVLAKFIEIIANQAPRHRIGRVNDRRTFCQSLGNCIFPRGGALYDAAQDEVAEYARWYNHVRKVLLPNKIWHAQLLVGAGNQLCAAPARARRN